MNDCDVSVIIPNFNRVAPLRRALASVLAQSRQPREIIVVDDCSTSEVQIEIKSIIAEFGGDPKIKLLVNEENRGANFSRNRGLGVASSRYVAFLDSDDLWMPEKLETQMSRISDAQASDGRPVLSATGRYRINGAGMIIARQFGGKSFDTNRISKSNFIGTLSSVVVETCAAREVFGFNEDLQAAQDWDFFIRLSRLVQFVGVEHPLCIYVDHNEQRITSNSRRRTISHLKMRRMSKADAGYPEMSMSDLYRIMAEDLQNTRNFKRADIFYAKHKYLTKSSAFRFLIPEWIVICLYSRWGAPKLKPRRYARYAQALERISRDPIQFARLEQDMPVIQRMMR